MRYGPVTGWKRAFGATTRKEHEGAHTDGCQRQGMWCCLLCGTWLVDSLAIQVHYGLFKGSLIYSKSRKVWPSTKIWREREAKEICPKGGGIRWLAFACKTPEHGWEEP
jgi:hypothetical protein